MASRDSSRAGVLYKTIMAYKRAGIKDIAYASRDKTSARGSLVKQIGQVKKMAQEAEKEEKRRERMRREKSSA